MANVAMRIRNTRQLRAIHDVLNGTDRPVSIEEIHHAAKVREPTLGVATVYRAVKALVEALPGHTFLDLRLGLPD